MDIEKQYQTALDLTHRMLAAANDQQWDDLSDLEAQRARVVSAIPPTTALWSANNPIVARRIAGIIDDIERESQEIVENVEAWRKHTRILLRLDKPSIT